MSWEGLNRRKFPRAVFPCMIKISRPGVEAETLLTHTENVSIGGVCVILRRHLEVFLPVSLEIDLLDGNETIACGGKIVWTVRRKAIEEHRPSCYDTGIEFVDIKAADHARIDKMLDHLIKTRKPDPEE